MIALRRAGERHHIRRKNRDAWLTFGPPVAASTDGFQALERLEENRVPPGLGVPSSPDRDAEIVTYVRDGSLAYEDGSGHSGIIHAGEFRCTTGVRSRAVNVSKTHGAHLFRTWLRPSVPAVEPRLEQKRFSTAERRGGLCVVASHDARKGSLRLHGDAVLFSALIETGQHLVHELAAGRSAWLHLVHGEASLDDLVLTAGDGAGFSGERAVSLTALQSAEILLLDLGDQPLRSPPTGGVS
jgi:quercetin 2,3-dioxygenase